MRMTYGPLWAHISHAVTVLARGSALWSAVLFKLVLTSAWVVLLWLVDRLMRRRALAERCAAILVVGWLPLGVMQSVGDGHNDALMVVGILAWIALLERGKTRWATAALALSVAVKYVSAPLFLLDILYVGAHAAPRPSVQQLVRSYGPRALIAAGTFAITFAPLFRSMRFFATTADVNQGHFFIPGDGALAVGGLLHVPAMPVAILVQLIFPVVAALALWRYVGSPTVTTFRVAVAAVLMVVLFDAAGHVWPWYVLWLVAPAALVPGTGIGRWATGVAIGAPFPLLVWITFPATGELGRYHVPALVMYSFALLWMLWLSRFALPSPTDLSARRS
jgi:alpha-1,6-mannosyltransferase